tara:strand:+ start:578 stop:790 length:213 start_codon:yes stop_codon:yes gene_type:complete
MTIILAFVLFSGWFAADNQDFFTTAKTQINQGAEWRYVGKSDLDLNAKSISICTDNCSKKYVFWKLKNPE